MQQKNRALMLIAGCLLAVSPASFGQITPNVRLSTPVKPQQQVRGNVADTNPSRLATLKIPAKNVWSIMADQFSMLRFAQVESDPDCKSNDCRTWKYTSQEMNHTTMADNAKSWAKKVAWKRFPAGTVYGRWEIAILPFPPGDDPNFTGIVHSGLVETKGIDSVYFDLTYSDKANMTAPSVGTTITVKPGTLGAVRSVPAAQPSQRPAKADEQPMLLAKLDKSVLSQFATNTKGERTFYIRILPLDANKNVLGKISNDITLNERFYDFKPAPQLQYLTNDYTITAVKYVQVQQPEPNFANCAIVTGYNEQPKDPGQSNPYIKNLSHDPAFVSSFKASIPIGTTLCPSPPKDKAWYEKAFDGVTGFIAKTIDGAANFYNETKNYLKNKFKEFNCSANGTITVINPVSKLQQVAGPEVCEALSGAAFDYGMAVVGLPPSLPNTSDFAQMAKGQIVELACDKIESETGVPIPDEVREKLTKEFHDNMVAQSNNGTVSTGFMQVKPHPKGQFRPAYLEIEVTRTGNTAKQKGLVSFSVSDVTTRSISAWSPVQKEKLPVDLKGNLFVETYTSVPFLENVGDKTTIYLVLKPQESYVHTDKKTGGTGSVQKWPPLGEWHTPPTPTYQGLTYTPGFQVLGSGSLTKFGLGLKVAEGVTLSFNNQ
jgi:hypothetical protein